jgi:hypothetical protein
MTRERGQADKLLSKFVGQRNHCVGDEQGVLVSGAECRDLDCILHAAIPITASFGSWCRSEVAIFSSWGRFLSHRPGSRWDHGLVAACMCADAQPAPIKVQHQSIKIPTSPRPSTPELQPWTKRGRVRGNHPQDYPSRGHTLPSPVPFPPSAWAARKLCVVASKMALEDAVLCTPTNRLAACAP